MSALRVLIVEDDPMIGPLLAEALEGLGHVVVAIEVDAKATVVASHRFHPNLLNVDIGPGERSAVAAVNEILRVGFVPHVFVAGDLLDIPALDPAPY